MSPTTAAEIANYIFEFTSTVNLVQASTLELTFPDNYDPSLTTYDKSVDCYL
jgi:hypothetical protein